MRTKTVLLIGLIIISGGMVAQTTDSKSNEKNKIKVHIEKEVNGKKTVIDTTFSSTDDAAYKTFMDEHEMKVEVVEGKGKDGKKIKKEVIVKMDDKKGNTERKMMYMHPDGPMPPMPPSPPSPPSIPEIDEDMKSFEFSWTDDRGEKHDEKVEKEIKVIRMKDSNEMDWNSSDIDKYLKDEKSSKRSRRNKKCKKESDYY
ncbi:MAG: hypothetical protein IPJ26_10890 [Bacteroidetes bacterium]|nr:hypothetical protein [Bacteroidota bacterium]